MEEDNNNSTPKVKMISRITGIYIQKWIFLTYLG